MRYEATSILSLKFVKECFVGKTNADLKLSLPFKSERAELKKMELPGDEISFYGYEGYKYAIFCYSIYLCIKSEEDLNL